MIFKNIFQQKLSENINTHLELINIAQDIDLAIKIAKNLNISNLGIDLVTNNISVSWKESSAIVCDVNISPETGEETAEAIIDSSLIKKENMDIHVFLEEQAHSQKSHNKYKELKKEGINAVYINSPRKANKEETFKNLNDLCYQASNDITTESIILSISCDQVLEFGFPLKKISYIHIPGLKEVWGDYYDDPKALTELEKQCHRVKEFR